MVSFFILKKTMLIPADNIYGIFSTRAFFFKIKMENTVVKGVRVFPLLEMGKEYSLCTEKNFYNILFSVFQQRESSFRIKTKSIITFLVVYVFVQAREYTASPLYSPAWTKTKNNLGMLKYFWYAQG